MKFFHFKQLQFCRRFCQLVRQNFSNECEKALNDQINMELNASYTYLSIAYHFNRSDVASPGIFKYFKSASLEEHHHAELIMEYMNKRGGTIEFNDILAEKCCYKNIKEALHKALSMELEVNQSLLELHELATKANDASLCEFIETNFLQEQVDAIKIIADYIKQIERCASNLGEFIFDKYIDVSMHKDK